LLLLLGSGLGGCRIFHNETIDRRRLSSMRLLATEQGQRSGQSPEAMQDQPLGKASLNPGNVGRVWTNVAFPFSQG
jgi:hypothetical protein